MYSAEKEKIQNKSNKEMDLMFNGLGVSLANLSRISDARTRSVCPENPTGMRSRSPEAEKLKQHLRQKEKQAKNRRNRKQNMI